MADPVGIQGKEMKEKMTEKKKAAWGVLCLGTLLVATGAIMIIQGITAYKTGAIIPATTKSGPMTGLQSIITGVIASVGGLYFVGNEIFRLFKGLKHILEVGKNQVTVKKKNKSWGTVNSLDLSLNGQLLTFYCTTDKVAAMLLNDFIIDQKAELEIKTSDGQQCELIGKNAYAHGMITVKSGK